MEAIRENGEILSKLQFNREGGNFGTFETKINFSDEKIFREKYFVAKVINNSANGVIYEGI